MSSSREFFPDLPAYRPDSDPYHTDPYFNPTQSSMTLSTTPMVAKPSMVDLRAGAIIRDKHASKPATYHGFNVCALLSTIMIVKTLLFGAWTVREYHYFDYRCALVMDHNNFSLVRRDILTDVYGRSKREAARLDPARMRQSKAFGLSHLRDRSPLDHQPRPAFLGKQFPPEATFAPHGPAMSTMVTEVNMEDLPSGNDDQQLRMKTIRSRTESILSLEHYMSSQSTMPSNSTDPTPAPRRKGKGKGRKKNRKKNNTTTTVEPEDKQVEDTTQFTKSPRHIMTSHDYQSTTASSHPSSFLHGAVDPNDPLFTNKGEIRAYQVQVASKKPKGKGRKKNRKKGEINVSKNVQRMWTMDEKQFDLYTSTSTQRSRTPSPEDETTQLPPLSFDLPTTTTTFVPPTRHVIIDRITIPSVDQLENNDDVITSSPGTSPIPTKDVQSAYNKWEDSVAQLVKQSGPIDLAPAPTETEDPSVADDTVGQVPYRVFPDTVRPPLDNSQETKKEMANRRFETERTEQHEHENRRMEERREQERQETERSRQGIHVYNKHDFQVQLETFSSSSLCVTRSLFDVWCISQVITALPYLLGITLAKKIYFIPHLVLDIMFLVIACLFSVTMVVFSVVLFIFVHEMKKGTLLEWLVFALLLDMALLVYLAVVIVSLRATDCLVRCRRDHQLLDANHL